MVHSNSKAVNNIPNSIYQFIKDKIKERII